VIDFRKLNPWRKTPTLFNWDDNWRPLLIEQTGPDGPNVTFDFVIPDEYYASLIFAYVQQTNSSGLGTSIGLLSIHRGSQEIITFEFSAGSQRNLNFQAYYFLANHLIDTNVSNPIFRQPIPPDIPLITGDRVQLNMISSKTSPRDPLFRLYLKAYYF